MKCALRDFRLEEDTFGLNFIAVVRSCWCVAGFFGPDVSGILFDAFGTYRVAVQVSGLASLLSSVAAATLKGEAAVLREKRAMELRAVEAAARNDTRYIDCTRTKENEWGPIDT